MSTAKNDVLRELCEKQFELDELRRKLLEFQDMEDHYAANSIKELIQFGHLTDDDHPCHANLDHSHNYDTCIDSCPVKQQLDTLVGNPNFAGILREYLVRGGKFKIASEKIWSKQKLYRPENGDIVRPVCHTGLNRSQILRMALFKLARVMSSKGINILVDKAHGASSGNDPHTAYENLDDTNFFGYLHDAINDLDDIQVKRLNEGFEAYFGKKRSSRVGDNDDLNISPEIVRDLNNIDDFAAMTRVRQYARSQFDEHYWKLNSEKRTVFFCFSRSIHITMSRLLENNDDLSNCLIIGCLWTDEINNKLCELPRSIFDNPIEFRKSMKIAHRDVYAKYIRYILRLQTREYFP